MKTDIHFPCYAISMPLDKNGNGPASPEETTFVTFEVWDQVANYICKGASKEDAEHIARLLNEVAPETKPLVFTYRNHRGELRQRQIIPDSLEWLSAPGFGYQPGWFLSGRDIGKDARRSFALSHIVLNDDQTKFPLQLRLSR